MVCCVFICCMCWLCRRCYLYFSACIITRWSIHGHSLPPQKENIGEDSAKRVPLDKRVYFIPDMLTYEMFWLGATTFIITVLCIWFYHAPLENHADPQVTPLGTTAPWYFLWIQGAFEAGGQVLLGRGLPDDRAWRFGAAALPGCDAEPALCASAASC